MMCACATTSPTLSKLSARRRIIAQDFMLPEKTKYSIFLPDLVLSGLLPEGFPPWKRNVQLESLKWLGASTQRFSENATCSGCIVHASSLRWPFPCCATSPFEAPRPT